MASLPTLAQKVNLDADADGIPGLLEYAFGLSPDSSDRSRFAGHEFAPAPRGLPSEHIYTAPDGQRYLELRFPRRRNAPLTYSLRTTANPSSTWSTVTTATVIRPLGLDWEMVRMRDTVPLGPLTPKRFVRLSVAP